MSASGRKSIIQKLEERYQKKIDEVNKIDITITELVALQIDRNHSKQGEFGLNDNKAALETEDSVIFRMILHIRDSLAAYAEKKHVEKVYINPKNYISQIDLEKMAISNAKHLYNNNVTNEHIREEKQKILDARQPRAILDLKQINHVTRLSTNEFSFYPSSQRGPLTTQGFSKLIGLIEDSMKLLPENIHLLLASFPVQTKNNVVQNVVIYAQSGKQPIINVFAKLYISGKDPVYPGTINPDYSLDVLSYAQESEIVDKGYNLFDMLCDAKKYQNVTVKNIDEIRNFFSVARNYVKPPIKFVEILDHIEEHIIKNAYSNNDGQSLARIDGQKFREEYLAFKRKMEDENMFMRTNIVSGALDNELGCGMDIQYGGNIECKTLGGERFRTIVDICLDHEFGVGKQSLGNTIAAARSVGEEILTNTTSHILTSNVGILLSEMVVGKSIVHVDPVYNVNYKSPFDFTYIVDRVSIHDIKNPPFGTITLISELSLKKILTHNEVFYKDVNAHNSLVIRLQALRHYRNQNPKKYKMVHEEIVKCIISNMQNEFLFMKEGSLKVDFLRIPNNIRDEIQKIFSDEKNSPSSMLSKINAIGKDLSENHVNIYNAIKKILLATEGLLKREEHDFNLVQAQCEAMKTPRNESLKTAIKARFFSPLLDDGMLFLVIKKLGTQALSNSEKSTLYLLMNSAVFELVLKKLKPLLSIHKDVIFEIINNLYVIRGNELSYQNEVLIEFEKLQKYFDQIAQAKNLQEHIKTTLSQLKEIIGFFSDIKASVHQSAPDDKDDSSILNRYISTLLIASEQLNDLKYKQIEYNYKGQAHGNALIDGSIKRFEQIYALNARKLVEFLDAKPKSGTNKSPSVR